MPMMLSTSFRIRLDSAWSATKLLRELNLCLRTWLSIVLLNINIMNAKIIWEYILANHERDLLREIRKIIPRKVTFYGALLAKSRICVIACCGVLLSLAAFWSWTLLTWRTEEWRDWSFQGSWSLIYACFYESCCFWVFEGSGCLFPFEAASSLILFSIDCARIERYCPWPSRHRHCISTSKVLLCCV